MSQEKELSRKIWSCQLCRMPREEETMQWEDTLRRGELGCWEDAALLERYLSATGTSQSACARTLGRSQASVANRLRILKLPEDIRQRMEREKLTERHARALLRLADPEKQRRALEVMLRERMNVAAAESYVEKLLASPEKTEERDLLADAVAALEQMQRAEPEIHMALRDLGSRMELTLTIPKKVLK